VQPPIRHLSRQQIDADRWDACVEASPHGLPYALSWYLDIVAPHWQGLVLGDYESVFPLPINRKMLGIPQVFAPFLCQQLGAFSRVPHPTDTARFLESARRNWYWRFTLPLHAHSEAPENERWHIRKAPNFLLPLDRDYPALWAAYSENHRRNIRKSHQAGLACRHEINLDFFLQKIKTYHRDKGNRIPDQLYPMAKQLVNRLLAHDMGRFSVATAPNGDIQAAVFWVQGKNRWINLLNLTLPDGQRNGAMHGLVDALVRERAGSGEIIDFEGSALPNLARFYRGFGAVEMPYSVVQRK
jgi:hypothetical protein